MIQEMVNRVKTVMIATAKDKDWEESLNTRLADFNPSFYTELTISQI